MTPRPRPTWKALLALFPGTALLATLLVLVGPAGGAAASVQERPNVVVIMTDDQDLASVRVQPRVLSMIGGKGTTFANSFASNPVCCPSRATFLTGRYSHNTGILRNSLPHGGFTAFDDSEALPVSLQAAGYRTGLIGKYMNGYGSGASATYIPPGWSEWYASIDPTTYRMYGYTLNENGQLVTYGDYATPDPAVYQTDVYATKAVDFIERNAPGDQPFFLEVAPLAPHTEVFASNDDDPPIPSFPNPRPAPRDADAFAHEPLPRGPSFNERNVSDKPEPIRLLPSMSKGAMGTSRKRNRSRLGTLLAVDDMVGRVVRALRQSGELDDTVLIYTSDNGFQLGEHRIPNGKQQPYEESLRVPLMFRGPGFPRGEVRSRLAVNVDLAPTIADLAGASLAHPIDGDSLLNGIDSGADTGGRAVVIENWCQTNEACFDPELPRYRGVRTDRFKYASYPNGEEELYDLDRDPYELRSRDADPDYAPELRALRRLYAEIGDCEGRGCRVAPRIRLALDFDPGRFGNGRRCAASAIVVTPAGADGRQAIAMDLRRPRAAAGADEERPLRFRLRGADLSARERTPVAADVTAADGRVRRAIVTAPRRC